MRIALICVTAVLVTSAVQTPAHADVASPARRWASTTTNNQESKSVEVHCPSGAVVVGMGGQAISATGGVALTSIVPGETSVSVTAHARPGFTGEWSLKAHAVCDDSGLIDPQVIVGADSAECPENTILYSTGFIAGYLNGATYVDQVVPDADLSGLTVHGVGTGPVVALGICAAPLNPLEDNYVRLEAEGTTVAKPPINGDEGSWIFGAGAIAPDGSYLCGLGVNSGLDAAWMGHQADTAMRLRTGGAGGTVYGILIGWWYEIP